MADAKKPVILLILDGFGHSDTQQYNAISAAKAPVWQKLWRDGPKTLIHTSGMAVGLPEGQMGAVLWVLQKLHVYLPPLRSRALRSCYLILRG